MPDTIWILNHYAVADDAPGGTRHFDFSRELVARGFPVTIFASNFLYTVRRNRLDLDAQMYRVEKLDGVNFVWLKTFPYQRNDWRRALNMLTYTLNVIRMGWSWKPAPQVIIGSSVHPFAGLAGLILARRHHARFFFEVRDLWPQTLVDMGYFSDRHPLVGAMRMMEKFLYRHAEKIIVLLPKAVDYITSLGFSASQVVCVPNGTAPSSELVMPLPEVHRLGGDGCFLVGYVGVHGYANGLDVLVDAAQLLRSDSSIRFVLVGDGPEKARLSKRAAELGLGNIVFLPPVPKSAVPGALAAMDALVFSLRPSPVFKYGLSSNKLFDYMNGGKPVIFAAEAGNNLIAEAGCGVTVPPADPAALVNAARQLQNLDANERNAMGARGRQFVASAHAIPVLVDKLCRELNLR